MNKFDFIEDKNRNIIRTNAFKIFDNKDELSKKLRNTKLCKYIERGEKCPRPPGTCRFAHRNVEIEKQNCFFGYTCKFKNSKTKRCPFVHPQDDKIVQIKSCKLSVINI